MPKYLLSLLLIFCFHSAFAQPLTSSIDSIQPSCNGVCNGYAHVRITGGTPPYNLYWNTLPVQTTTGAANLCPGAYQVVILDANNNSTVSNVTITNDAIRATVSNTNLNCSHYGVDTSTVTPVTGFTPFTYRWNGGTSTTNPTIYNLPVGNNTVMAIDKYGCAATDTFLIKQPTEIKFINQVQQPRCFDSSNGIITAQVIGGTAPYTYKWDGDTALHTNVRPGAAAGVHILVVKDSNNCVVADTAIVAQPTPIAITTLNINPACFNSANGIISAMATGGVSTTYTYSWNTVPTQTTSVIKYLHAGVYIVTVRDTNNCPAYDTITLTQPPALTDSTHKTDITTCYGYHTGIGLVFPSGGTPPYHLAWLNTNYTGTAVDTLAAGTYPINVIDFNNCITTDTIHILQPPAIATLMSATPDTGNCNGTAMVIATGGTGRTYTYRWNIGATTSAIVNLCGNVYTVTVTDSNHCSVTDSIRVPVSTTGVGNVLFAGDITIAPNPFSEYLVINSGGSPVSIHITNAAGITVSTINSTTGKSSQKISTSTWAPGLYLITITDAAGNIITRKKLVKD